MKAMIFAAGIGSRLGKITENLPKCLVPLSDGTTMLDKVVERLKGAGVTSLIINLFHKGDLIKKHCWLRNHYEIEIKFSEEESLLGTGGGLKKAAWFFDSDEPFVVHNGDIYSEFSLQDLLSDHISSKAIVTLAVMKRDTSRVLVFSEDNILLGWENLKEKTGGMINSSGAKTKQLAFSGIQVMNRSIFSYMENFTGNFPTIPTVFLEAVNQGAMVRGFEVNDPHWIDMGTAETLSTLNKMLERKKI